MRIVLALTLLWLPASAVNITDTVADCLDAPYPIEAVVLKPISFPSAGPAKLYLPGTRSAGVTNGAFGFSQVVGGLYDVLFDDVATIRIVAPPNDTNTYTVSQLAFLATNLVNTAVTTNLNVFIWTNSFTNTPWPISWHVRPGTNMLFRTNNPGAFSEYLTLDASGTGGGGGGVTEEQVTTIASGLDNTLSNGLYQIIADSPADTNLLTVKSFGAVGNGTADDTAAIQAAIDYLTNSVGYNEVLFPVGTYKVTAPLKIRTYATHLRGSGIDRTQITVSGTTNDGVVLDTVAILFAKISDMTLYKSPDSTSKTAAIKLHSSSGMTTYAGGRFNLFRVKIYGFYYGVDFGHCTGATLENVEAYGNVKSFFCRKIDSAVFINCFAGDGWNTTGFGALTNESVGFTFTNFPGNYGFNAEIIGGESRRSRHLIDIYSGNVKISGWHNEIPVENVIRVNSGAKSVMVDNCLLWAQSGLPVSLINIASGAGPKVSVRGTVFEGMTAGQYAIQLNGATDYIDYAGPTCSVTNTASGSTNTLGNMEVAADSGIIVTRTGNRFAIQATNTVTPRTGLLGYWTMDETDNPLLDSSTAFHNAYQTNGVDSIIGKVGNAVHVGTNIANTTTNFVAVPITSPFIGENQHWTAAAWVRRDGTAWGADDLTLPFIGQLTDTNYSWVFGYSGPAVNRFEARIGNTKVTDTANGTISTNVWYWVCAWWDGTNIYLQRNNSSPISASYTGTVPQTHDGNLYIGGYRYGDGDKNWFGAIDEVGVWNRVLTATEREQIYNAGSGRSIDYWEANELDQWSQVSTSAVPFLSSTTNFFSGAIHATAFDGSGSALTNLNASALASGTVAEARLPGSLTRFLVTNATTGVDVSITNGGWSAKTFTWAGPTNTINAEMRHRAYSADGNWSVTGMVGVVAGRFAEPLLSVSNATAGAITGTITAGVPLATSTNALVIPAGKWGHVSWGVMGGGFTNFATGVSQ